MAKSNSTVPPIGDPLDLSHQLHAIAARLAGLSDILRNVADDTGAGNTLQLMADVAAEANSQLCLCADRVRNLRADDKEVQS